MSSGQQWFCDSDHKWECFIDFCQELKEKDAKKVFSIRNPGRTELQNNAMHKYFALLSGAFNEADLDKVAVLSKKLPTLWTPHGVKEDVWKPAQAAMCKKDSTTALETDEVGTVYRVVDRFTSQNFGIHVPFPNRHGV